MTNAYCVNKGVNIYYVIFRQVHNKNCFPRFIPAKTHTALLTYFITDGELQFLFTFAFNIWQWKLTLITLPNVIRYMILIDQSSTCYQNPASFIKQFPRDFQNCFPYYINWTSVLLKNVPGERGKRTKSGSASERRRINLTSK